MIRNDLQFYVLFNSILVIRMIEGMELYLRLKIFLPSAGMGSRTARTAGQKFEVSFVIHIGLH